MKKLSDYKGEEAILLWGDLLTMFTDVLADKEIADAFRKKAPALLKAKMILEKKPKVASDILLRIDDSPLDGVNVITRMVSLITEMMSDPELMSFFGLQVAVTKGETPSGSATGNTEENESQDTSSDM